MWEIVALVALWLAVSAITVTWVWRTAPKQVRRRLRKDLARERVEATPDVVAMIEDRRVQETRWGSTVLLPLSALGGLLWSMSQDHPRAALLLALTYAAMIVLPGAIALALMVTSSRRTMASRRVASPRCREVGAYVPRFDLWLGRAFAAALLGTSLTSFVLVAVGYRSGITVALAVVSLLGVLGVSLAYTIESYVLALPSRAETEEEMEVNDLLVGRAVRNCESSSTMFVLASIWMTSYYLLLPADYVDNPEASFPPTLLLVLVVTGLAALVLVGRKLSVDRSYLRTLGTRAPIEPQAAGQAP